MTSVALFPGQGSQTADIGAFVARVRPDLLAHAIELVGEDPFPRVAEAGRFAQPAVFCASITWWDDLGGLDVAAAAGHSLGEFAALVCAGALDAHDALRLVALRGRLTDDAAGAGPPGGMVAVLGRDAAEQADRLSAAHGLTVANDNGPQQLVLSGPRDAVLAAARDGVAAGVACSVLPVPGAMHSEALRPAVEPFRRALQAAPFSPPRVPVVSCTTGRPIEDPATDLAETLVRPVRWPATIQALVGLGADRFIDVGPGRVLRGLTRRIVPGAWVVSGEQFLGSGAAPGSPDYALQPPSTARVAPVT